MGVLLTSGKWMYEVEIKAAGTGHVGWCCTDFWQHPDAASYGAGPVGFDHHGWSFDGCRGSALHDVSGRRSGIPAKYGSLVAGGLVVRPFMRCVVRPCVQVWSFVACGRRCWVLP